MAEREGCCKTPFFTIEWAMWANVNALYSAVFMFIGGVVAATMETINENSLPVHSFGVVARWIVIGLSLIIFFIEYPRGKRRKNKKNVERPGQSYIAPVINLTFFVGKIYIFRVIFYILAIIPCIFVLPAILSAITLFISCVCYFIAAINGEEWEAPSLAWGPGATQRDDTPKVGHTLPEAPSHPPPRPPPQARQGLSAPPSAPPPRPKTNLSDAPE
ncbi:cytochrome b-245 light chain-like [Halichondria panicea]|uniref:cytochrome b-245 light chain-like n=1 Tax=Halichondria panicea TaxID=6063 RepID=UPI00312B776C